MQVMLVSKPEKYKPPADELTGGGPSKGEHEKNSLVIH
jgi:hypothetical protein